MQIDSPEGEHRSGVGEGGIRGRWELNWYTHLQTQEQRHIPAKKKKKKKKGQAGWGMSRYSNCFACLTIMLVCASSSASQPAYRSIETFLRGPTQALLLQLCLSCIQVHISVRRPCLRTPWRRSSAIPTKPASSKCSSATLYTSSARSRHTRHQMAHTVATRIVLGKLHGRTGSPPKPFWFVLHPVPSNIHSNDLSFTDTYCLCFPALLPGLTLLAFPLASTGA